MGRVSGTIAPERVERPDVDSDRLTEAALPWVTIVWNDPINLMSYVTSCLVRAGRRRRS